MKQGPLPKTTLRQLYYKQKLSMQDIAGKIGVSWPTVVYWMKKHNLPRRSCSESAYCKLNPNGDPFNIKKQLNKKEKDLLLTGLMLYWAEGNKSIRGSMQLANLDHRMLQVYVKFLRDICRVREEKLRLYVRVHKRFSLPKAKRYWMKTLEMPKSRIFVYPHTDGRSKVDKQWSPFGIATLQLCNLKLYDWVNNTIKEYLEKILNDQN